MQMCSLVKIQIQGCTAVNGFERRLLQMSEDIYCGSFTDCSYSQIK